MQFIRILTVTRRIKNGEQNHPHIAEIVNVKIGNWTFLSRFSILLLTRDIDIVILSVRPSVFVSVRDTLVLYENGLTYRHSFSTIR